MNHEEWPKWPKATSVASGCVGTTARACPRLLPLCFVLRWLPWSTHEATSDFNCSTSLHQFIMSSSPSYTTRRVPLFRERERERERERGRESSVVIGSSGDDRHKSKKEKKRKPTRAFGFSSRHFLIDGIFFLFVPYGRGVTL